MSVSVVYHARRAEGVSSCGTARPPMITVNGLRTNMAGGTAPSLSRPPT